MGDARPEIGRPRRERGANYFLLEPSVAQPPLPLQEFLPAHPLSPVLHPPLPLQEFWPAQACFSATAFFALALEGCWGLSCAWRRAMVPLSSPVMAAASTSDFLEISMVVSSLSGIETGRPDPASGAGTRSGHPTIVSGMRALPGGISRNAASLAMLKLPMLRVRFAPSPTGYLHIGSARTFIFNWLYARHNGGTMILRIDDTDLERNTQESLDSIFDGLKWLDLGWDELYRQSERVDKHRGMAMKIFEQGLAYRDFTPAAGEREEKSRGGGPFLFSPEMRELPRAESDRRAAAGEPFVLRFRVPREREDKVIFHDLVYGEQLKATADIEDFALLRSTGAPTYHMASCADDADLRISHIIRGQDHLTNTFKHVLIFRALGGAAEVCAPAAADCPRRIEIIQAQARAGGQRDHLPRRGIFAARVREFRGAAGMVA